MMGPEKEMFEVMEALQVVVNAKGGINSTQHIGNFIKWMSDAQGFDVRIVYVCVVNATDNRDVLLDFINQGGWNCLAKWLEYFITTNKHAAIRELLKCFQKLPISPKTLSGPVESKDLPGKMIKGLRKHHDQEIKEIAGTIYKRWIRMVDEQNEREKERKARKREKEAAAAELARNPKKPKQGPTLADNFMDNAFLSEEQKKKALEEKKKLKQKKKDEKRKKEETKKENQKPVQFGEHLSFLNNLANTPEDGAAIKSKFDNMGNRSPPMHARNAASSSPPQASDLYPKKEPKPGAKSVRWADQTGQKPLEQIREFEVIPNERVNVNHQDYKMKMDLEAFKEAECLVQNRADIAGMQLGDLMPKRQWRSPKRTMTYVPDAAMKNLELWSKDSNEKLIAAEKTARSLQQIFLKAQIPPSPTEPENFAQQIGMDIPKIPLEMKDTVEKVEQSPTPTLNGIDFTLLNQINIDDIQSAVNSTSKPPTTVPSAIPTPAPVTAGIRPNMYDPEHSNSRSPPAEERFNRQPHAPNAAPRHPEGRPPLGQHDGSYRNNFRPTPYGQPPFRRDGYGYGRGGQDHRFRDRSPNGHRSRSPQGPFRRSGSPPRRRSGSPQRVGPLRDHYRPGGYNNRR